MAGGGKAQGRTLTPSHKVRPSITVPARSEKEGKTVIVAIKWNEENEKLDPEQYSNAYLPPWEQVAIGRCAKRRMKRQFWRAQAKVYRRIAKAEEFLTLLYGQGGRCPAS